MHIRQAQVLSYKSIEDSGIQSFDVGFNVVVGQNNVGKTAFLEALTLRFENHPHRNASSSVGSQIARDSSILASINVDGSEFRNCAVNAGRVSFPVPKDIGHDANSLAKYIDNCLKNQSLNLSILRGSGGFAEASGYPSHGLFAEVSGQKLYLNFHVDRQSGAIVPEAVGSGPNDDVGIKIVPRLADKIYAFKAERLNVSRAQYGAAVELKPDASNLAEVLNHLQGNPARFERLNSLVRTVFPHIKQVSVAPANSLCEIRVWSVAGSEERLDLARSLDNCGTGIGQVLAILYVLISSDAPRTIIVDEPSTFLHPGAARKLIEIMKASAIQHQFIISTHSPEIISAAEPNVVLLAKWESEKTTFQRMDSRQSGDLRLLMCEVGVRLSDVFGADRILWVEGPTEEICFPKILRHFSATLLFGTAITALVNTGDLEKKNKPRAEVIWGVYKKLSTPSVLMPSTVGFLLDSELRTESQKAELEKLSGGAVKFLPRRAYENYLIHPAAIAAVLGASEHFKSAPLRPEAISEWLFVNGGKFYKGKWSGDLLDQTWLKAVDAPKLLAKLFSELSNTTEEYRKIEHSVRLTDWLIDHSPDDLKPLGDFLAAQFRNG